MNFSAPSRKPATKSLLRPRPKKIMDFPSLGFGSSSPFPKNAQMKALGKPISFLLNERVPNWIFDLGRCPKKTFWTKASNWILFETALKCISPKSNGKVPDWRSDFGWCPKKLFEVPNLLVFAKRRCPTGVLILEGALKKTFWTKASNWIAFEPVLKSISPKCNGIYKPKAA